MSQTGVGTYAKTVDFRMPNVTIDVTGGGQYAYGFNGHGIIKNCTISAANSGVGMAVAMFDNSNTHTTITGSKLSGADYSIQIQSGSVDVAASELDGPVSGPGIKCVTSWNAIFDPLDSGCAP